MRRFLLGRIALVLSFCTVASVAAPAERARDMTAEAEIEADLSRRHPALLDTFRKAREAWDRDDFVSAEQLNAQVVVQAPDFDPAVRRLGAAMIRNGRVKEGVAHLERALAINRSAANLSTLAYSLGYPQTSEATAVERQRALDLLLECRGQPRGEEEDILVMTAHLALLLDRLPVARQAGARLEAKFPDLMQTHYFAAILAANDEHWIKANEEIRAAEARGLDAESVQRFLASGVGPRAMFWRWVRVAWWVILSWVGGMAVLFALGSLLSVLTLRQIERADPRVPVTSGEHAMRRAYRVILNVTGAYYYISLPVVFLIVVLATGAVVYGFILAGQIPIKLTAILVIGALVTLWTMGRSLFLRVAMEDIGEPLRREEAPGLWQLTEDVARDIGTRPIDDIRITPGTDLCVYERGTWREKLRDQARRVLVVGTGVLNGFRQVDFRSVLAHEYGHFSNRDTAGGDIALRVQNDMLKFYYAMVAAEQAHALNVAFHFLRAYNFIFRRISHGAARLQEVLADRIAALHYGPKAFEGGLRHVIRQSVEFDFTTGREIQQALKARQPINNLYSVEAPSEEAVHKEFTAAIERPTTPDDTHPGPTDRFRLISGLPEPAEGRVAGQVWDLFTDKPAIINRMMESVERNVAAHRN